MICSQNECVFIRDMSDLTVQIILNAWWASMNVGSKLPMAWINSRHVASWWFDLHCGVEETGSPGMICIICHHVLCHPSEHGTSSMRNHLLWKAHITSLNMLTESKVAELTSSMVDDTALAIPMTQRIQGITLVSSQRTFIFDIQLNPYWSKWQTKHSKPAAKDYETSECHQATGNRYLILWFRWAQIPWPAISNLELRWSCKALRSDPTLPSARTLINTCRREYALTMDAIQKQLLSWNKVSLAFDGWTSTIKLAITSVIAYYMDRNWASGEVQLAFHESHRLLFSGFES